MVGVLGDAVEIRVDGVAEHGERDEGLALENRAAKFLLQRDNGIGQRGLGNAAAFGRRVKLRSRLASEVAIGTDF